jgi:excisionase family DNA binding protein
MRNGERFRWASLLQGCAFVCFAIGLGSKIVAACEPTTPPSLVYGGEPPAGQDTGYRIPEIQTKGEYSKICLMNVRSGVSMAVGTTNFGAYGQNSGEPVFWTAKDVAAVMKISDKTVFAKAGKDEIPHYRFGRSVRFRKDEVLAWLNEHSSGPRVSLQKDTRNGNVTGSPRGTQSETLRTRSKREPEKV